MWTWVLFIYSRIQVDRRATHITEESIVDANGPFSKSESLKPLVPRLAPAAVPRVVLAFEVHWNNRTSTDALEEWAVNGITFETPKEPLLHGNYFDGTFNYCIANEHQGRVDNIHATYIEHFEYGHTYEVLMINYDPQLHPWHLYGYSVDFIVVRKIPSLAPATW